MNSRAKGCRGEREFRDVLREHGYCKAHRGQQYSGLRGNADVVCPELPGFHFEVKRVEAGNPYLWIAQARRDAAGESDLTARIPVVAHKRNHSEWLAILPMSQFLEIVRRSDLIGNNGESTNNT